MHFKVNAQKRALKISKEDMGALIGPEIQGDRTVSGTSTSETDSKPTGKRNSNFVEKRVSE